MAFGVGCATFAQQLMTVTVAGKSGQTGFVNGDAAAARFISLSGIAVDSAGDIFVAESGVAVIRKISTAGVVSTFAGSPGMQGYQNGAGPAARLSSPEAIAFGPDGSLFVADLGNFVIRKITPDGTVSLYAGTPGIQGTVDGRSTTALFFNPAQIAVDPAGNVYVGDYTSVRKITPQGIVSTLAGGPYVGIIPPIVDGVGAGAWIGYVNGLTVDPAGTVYFSDGSLGTIRRITPSGVVTTIAGAFRSTNVSVDGVGANAGFNFPGAMAMDKSGNVWLLDMSNTVRRVTPAGVVTTIAGTFAYTGSTDGPDNVVRFNRPNALAFDPSGNLVISDCGNAVVRRRQPVYAPVVTRSPQDVTVAPHTSAILAVEVSGIPVPALQWTRNGALIPGATGSTFTIADSKSTDSAEYTVIATNIAGTITSSPATVLVYGVPQVITPPQAKTIADRDGLTLAVTAASSGAMTYQWQKDGVDVPGATSSTYTVDSVSPSDAGSYSVVLKNAAGSVTTSSVNVTVIWSRFINMSVLSYANQGDAALILGFGTAGPSQSLLVRGVGPALAAYDVASPIPDPQVSIFLGETRLFSNDTWSAVQDPAAMASTFDRVGAFKLQTGSTDAALIATLDQNIYTAVITPTTGAGGTGLAELYALNQKGGSRLINLSARASVGNGGLIIAGFVIDGNTRKRVLIRGVGPSLSRWVSPVLTTPRITLFQTGLSPISNAGWSSDATVATAGDKVGAFPLTAGSRDAAMVLQLDPGSYTVHLDSATSTEGIALLEVYEVP